MAKEGAKVGRAQAAGSGRAAGGRPSGAAFLLAQVGAHGARLFAERLVELGLSPPHAGIFRVLGSSPGLTQKELATALGTLPNRIVGLLDEMEAKGLIERRVQEQDRRRHALHITEAGQKTAAALGAAARKHQAVLLEALTEEERAELAALLQRIADQQGLIPRVHPGYAWRRDW